MARTIPMAHQRDNPAKEPVAESLHASLSRQGMVARIGILWYLTGIIRWFPHGWPRAACFDFVRGVM